MDRRIGVCSWSLQPESAADLARKIKGVGVSAVQLALEPLRTGAWEVKETVAALEGAGIAIRSGMMAMRGEDYSTLETIKHTGGVRLDEHWDANLEAAGQNAELARQLGVRLVTFHAGFIPESGNDPARSVMLNRLRAVVDRFAELDVNVAFETGQETAETLLDALDELDRGRAGVNFDPANMILYGMGDPVAALRMLAARVVQVHLKDAVATETPGSWGRETPVGDGAVDWAACFGVLGEAGLDCDLMLEREGGVDRVGDLAGGRQLAEQFFDV